MSDSSYYASIMSDERLLREHGLNSWPTEEELARRVLGIEDAVTALALALDLAPRKDLRGRWLFERRS